MILQTPIGHLRIEIRNERISGCTWIKGDVDDNQYDYPLSEFERKVAREMDEYFSGNLKEFSLPLDISEGTEFQRKVWKALSAIPYGATLTYGELAKQIGHPAAVRAVGMACKKNPIGIILPCHRVVGSKGLTGYNGGLEKKLFLLKLEKSKDSDN